MSHSIRQAKNGDEHIIHDYICKLADYEKLHQRVQVTLDDITRDFFGSHPRVFCDLGFWNGRPAGFSIWFYDYSTFRGRAGIYLEDLFVDEDMRGHGIGKALFCYLAQRCTDEKLLRLKWSVLDWNAPSIAFYDSLGAVAQKEWLGYDLTGDALQGLAT
jgi:GNAT superfamily N-acetyltransferase